MPKLLTMKDKEVRLPCLTVGRWLIAPTQGWSSFHRQLVSLFRFLAPFLRQGELADTTRALYLGTERILLVLVHDFPDFLSQAAFSLVDVIPTHCTQLLNLVLSAFPIPCQVPDPLQRGLKLEEIADISVVPTMLNDYTAALSTAELRLPLDKYLQSREPSTFPALLKERLQYSGRQLESTDPKANIPLTNSLVLHLGTVAVNQSKAQTGNITFSAKSSSYILLKQLLDELEPEGRYFLIAAAASQLRYPNAHTYWFATFLLTAFAESQDDQVREQVLRVLLERIIAARPHPWGILYTTHQILTSETYRDVLEQQSRQSLSFSS
jgi:CCR4-NOT transcription complex subunit 1